jgi:hypothetical protein
LLVGQRATTSAATFDQFSVIGESLPRTDPYTWKVLALQQ